jgi:hypothetical protein
LKVAVTVHWDIDKISNHILTENSYLHLPVTAEKKVQNDMTSKLCMSLMKCMKKTMKNKMKKEDKNKKERRIGAQCDTLNFLLGRDQNLHF